MVVFMCRVSMVVCVVMLVMCLAQDVGTHQVHRQAKHPNDDGFFKLNRLRRDQPFKRANHHGQSHAQQKQGAGKARQNFDFPSAKGKARVIGVSASSGIGHG